MAHHTKPLLQIPSLRPSRSPRLSASQAQKNVIEVPWGRFKHLHLSGKTRTQHHQLTFSMAHHPTLLLSKMHKRRWTPQKTIQNTTNLQCAILGTKNLRWVGEGSKHQQLFFKKDLLWHTTEHHCQNCFLKKNILPQTWHLQNVTYIWEGFTFQM